MATLIFAYSTDPKIFGVKDDCRLISLTRRKFLSKDPWKNFLDGINYHKVFYYRKDFRRAHPELNTLELPLVLLKDEDRISTVLDSNELKSMSDVNELIGLLAKKLSGF